MHFEFSLNAFAFSSARFFNACLKVGFSQSGGTTHPIGSSLSPSACNGLIVRGSFGCISNNLQSPSNALVV